MDVGSRFFYSSKGDVDEVVAEGHGEMLPSNSSASTMDTPREEIVALSSSVGGCAIFELSVARLSSSISAPSASAVSIGMGSRGQFFAVRTAIFLSKCTLSGKVLCSVGVCSP